MNRTKSSSLRALAMSLAAFAVACGGGGGGPPGRLPDLLRADAAPDLKMDPPDLKTDPGTDGGSDGGTDMAAGTGEVTSAHGTKYKFVVNKLSAPQTKTDYSVDLNGDGKVDNQFGNIFGALASQGIDIQMQFDDATTSGAVVHLLELQTADPQFQNDDQVGVMLAHGSSVGGPPDFSGNGKFSLVGAYPAGTTYGKLAGGVYRSNNPITTKIPVSLTLRFPIIGGPPVALPVNGAFIRCTAAQSGLMSGQINGSIRQSDVEKKVFPAVAANFTQMIQTDPNSQQSQQLKAIFDVGNGNGGPCINPDGSQGQPSDNVISICEIAGNSIVANIFAPDVDIFDANDNYSPNAANAMRESLSIGVGFTAVRATW